jgi:hypothetical protein
MNKILLSIICIAIFLVFSPKSYAVYNPTEVPNNKFGIHILFPEEISQAADLVNSSGGEWGYVTIPIRASEKDIEKWQTFMDECRKLHLIPIIRIATEGDYFIEGSWEKPNKYYIIDFANFLNSLNWPTENRYVIIFNEQNRGDEWGGTPDPESYADILNHSVYVFKARSDKFFIIFGGLDNAAPDQSGEYISQLNYIRQVESAFPGVLSRIDGISVHSYPNPGFSSPPTYRGQNGIYSHYYVEELVTSLTGKKLPIFITETGWTNSTINEYTQATYYNTAFQTAWSDPNIIAVTPFLLVSNAGPFEQFSFIRNGKKTHIYNNYRNIPKVKGQPKIEPELREESQRFDIFKIKDFEDKIKSSLKVIDNNAKTFFKWLLNL